MAGRGSKCCQIYNISAESNGRVPRVPMVLWRLLIGL